MFPAVEEGGKYAENPVIQIHKKPIRNWGTPTPLINPA
jgi:hypothetical protein